MPTAIEIFKHLPKKNCGECRHPTCLAFAMQLANQKAKLEDCPYVSEAGKQSLAASSAPPIRLVRSGPEKLRWRLGTRPNSTAMTRVLPPSALRRNRSGQAY